MADSERLNVSRADLVYSPLEWQKRGLSETRSGYGRKLRTVYKLRHAGRLLRVYACVFSNVGTLFIISGGKTLLVDCEG